MQVILRAGSLIACLFLFSAVSRGQVFDNQCPVGQSSMVPLRTVNITTGHFNDTVCADIFGNLNFLALNPSLSASDTFTRANGALGSNWNTGIVAPTIQSNAAGGISGQYSIAQWKDSALVSSTQFAQATIAVVGVGESGPAVFVSNITPPPATNGAGYFCGEGTTSITLYRTAGSVTTSLGTSAITGANGDILRLEITAVGGLTCYRNGVSTLTASDTTYKSGSPGLIFRGAAGTPSTYNNWSGGNLPVSAGTGPTLQVLNGNPIVGSSAFPCTAVGINAAIAALPKIGGVVDARGCQASITGQTATIQVGTSAQQVRLQLPSVTYSGSANPLFVVDRASILELQPGTIIQQTANAANGIILAGQGPQWISGGIEGHGQILGPGQATSTGAGVIYGGGTQPGNLTGNGAQRTHIGPVKIGGFQYGIQFGNFVWSINIQAFVGDSAPFTNSNNVGVYFPAGTSGTGESIVFNAPANISGNINQGIDVEIASSLWVFGVSIDSNGLGTANPQITLNGVNSLFYCASCWIEDVTGTAQTHNFITGNNNQIVFMGGILQEDATGTSTGAFISMAGSGDVTLNGTMLSVPNGTMTNGLLLSGSSSASFNPNSVSVSAITNVVNNSGTGYVCGFYAAPGVANKFACGPNGAASTGAAGGDLTAARGVASGAYFLGTDGNGFIFRNGSTVTLASGAATATFPSLTGTLPAGVFNAAGTAQASAVHIVQDTATLAAGTVTITLTGSAIFTNATSYTCVADDDTAIAATRVLQNSGSSITITGTGTDVIRYICVGN